MKLTSNYHTHTSRCGHACGGDREYIEAAIAAGIKVLGFSDHTPMVFDTDHHSGHRMALTQADEYFTSLTDLKKEYRDDIEIHIGVETEYYPATHERYMEFMSAYPCEYMILGQHFLDREEDGIVSIHPHGEPELLRHYCRNVLDGLKTGDFLYVAHPDLFNFTGDPAEYRAQITALLKEIKALSIPLEINRLGFADHRNYPCGAFWKLAGEVGNTAVIGLDAHSPDVFADAASEAGCAALAETYGLTVQTSFSFHN